MTHYYTYDGINLIKEEWGNNIIVFLYDASGSPVGMQYRNSSYATGIWDTYYYEKNLQGDIVAVYNACLSITTNDPVRRAHERGFSLI